VDRAKVLTIAGVALVAIGVLLLVALLLRGLGEAEDPVRAEAPEVPSADGPPPSAEPYGGRVPLVVEREPEGESGSDRARPRPADRVRSVPDQIELCFPGVIPTRDGCASREVVAGYATERVGVLQPGGEAEPLTVELADPEDIDAPPREVATCDEFMRLKSRGWGPLTSVAISRELEMLRFCGLVRMASRAAAPVRQGLDTLDHSALLAVRPGDWPTIGEASPRDPLIRRDEAAGRWVAEGETVTITLRDVGSADFDGDGAGEVLVYATVRPDGAGGPSGGGTARGGGYLLAERDGGDGPVRLTPADLY
jgi:hypothetical protein